MAGSSAAAPIVAALVFALAGCGGSEPAEPGAASASPQSASASPSGTAGPEAGASADPSATPGGTTADMSPGEILDASYAAAQQAQSMGVTTSVSTPQGATAYALRLSDDGLTGRAILPTSGPIELTIVDGSLYMRGGPALYAQFLSEGEARAAEGSWLKLPEQEAISIGLLPAIDKQGLLASAIAPQENRKLTKTGSTRRFDGVPAIGLDSGKGVLWVAAEGTPYPLALTSKDKSAGTFEMVDWDEPLELVAPPAEQVVDLGAGAQPGP